MATSLAVVWAEGEHEPAIGRLELLPGKIHLEGACHGRYVSEDVPLPEITQTRFGRADRERIRGRQTLVLERIGAQSALLVTSVFGVGTLTELIELLRSAGTAGLA
jgi:hypothetical protein